MGQFDNALRLTFQSNVEDLVEFLVDQQVEGPIRFQETDYPGETIHPDFVIECGSPPTRIFHVEVQLTARRTEMGARMLKYFARLYDPELPAPEQFVIVLSPDGGELSGYFAAGGASIKFQVIHLWQVPAEQLLAHPSFYALAVLGQTDDRSAVFNEIVSRPGPAEARQQVNDIAATLASIHLPSDTIDELLRRVQMHIDLMEIPNLRKAADELYRPKVLAAAEQARIEARQQAQKESEAAQLSLVIGLAERRFGTLSTEDRAKIAASPLEPAQLQELVLDSADVKSLISTL